MAFRSAIADQTVVALSLANRLASTASRNSNFVFSPPSIHAALALVAAGSGGRTLAELLSFLKSETPEDLAALMAHFRDVVFADGSAVGGSEVALANSVWMDCGLSLKPEFKKTMDCDYKAHVKQVDFLNKGAEAVAEVNSWVENVTKGLIKDLMDPESADDPPSLVLVNAVYFRGFWEEEFEPERTRDRDFHLLNGSSVKAPFMTHWIPRHIGVYDGYRVLRLPYVAGEDERSFSMYIFLPDAKDGLHSLAKKLCSEPGFVDKHDPGVETVGEFWIPKFKIAFGCDVTKTLQKLGLTSPFTEGVTEMVDSWEGIPVSCIIHKAFIEVNEQGTEAAAATDAEFHGCSLEDCEPPPPVDFVADHPFLFLIKESRTGVVLFMGHVLNPLQVCDHVCTHIYDSKVT